VKEGGARDLLATTEAMSVDTILVGDRGSPEESEEKSAPQLSDNPETVRMMERMMRDVMLGTIERHTEKIVSALLAISDQRVEDISKRSQQAEERFFQLIVGERQEREDMRKSVQEEVKQNQLLAESGIAQVGKDFVTLRLQLQSLAEVTSDVGPELQRLKVKLNDESKEVSTIKERLLSRDTGGSTMSPSPTESMDSERKEFRKSLESFEALQRNFELLKGKLTQEISQERTRISALIQDVQLQVAANPGNERAQPGGDQAGGGTSAHAKAFKSVLDQRIKEVATTIDQVVKDFACSLEGERAQRQEGDRLLTAMSRDLSKFKDRLEGVSEEVEGVKRLANNPPRSNSPMSNLSQGAETQQRWDAAMRMSEDKLQEVVARIDVIEEGCFAALAIQREQNNSGDNQAAMNSNMTQEFLPIIKSLSGQVDDFGDRICAVEECCAVMLKGGDDFGGGNAAHRTELKKEVREFEYGNAALAQSVNSETQQVDALKQELAGIRHHDYVFCHEPVAPRAIALEEALEQRVQEVAGNFQLEQRAAILAMQSSVGRLESLARNVTQDADDAARISEAAAKAAAAASAQLGQVQGMPAIRSVG